MVPYKDQSEVCKHAKPAKLVTVGDENIKSLDSEQLLHTAKSTFGDHNSSCAKSSYSIYTPEFSQFPVSILPKCGVHSFPTILYQYYPNEVYTTEITYSSDNLLCSKSSSFIDESVGRNTSLFGTAITTLHRGYTMLAVEYLQAMPLVVCMDIHPKFATY